MNITKFSLEHATAVFVLIVCIVIGGFASYMALPREAAPDVDIPVVIVSTPYFGVSPADIETLVTQPLEKEFKGLRDIKEMTSTSAESVSLITLEFQTGVEIDEALQKVREKVDKAKPDLPPDAEDPEVIEINPSDWPVMVANVSGNMDPVRLKNIAEEMQDELEKIPGVLRVDLAGGVEREIQVLVDPQKMRHYGVSSNDVIGAIQRENVNLPGGSIEMGAMKYLVRVPGEFETIAPIEDILIKAPEGNPIYVRDVAQVRDSFKDPETFSRLTTWQKGEGGRLRLVTQPNVSLSVVKRAGENIIEIADQAKTVIRRYEQQLATGGVNIAIANDMSVQIRDTVHDLENNIISGLILVLAVLFFFMGGIRNALFVAVSVPLSMLITFIVLRMMGITLNMVVLFSLIMALGMLVDNAIVIVENIYRHANMGKGRFEAAYDGTSEVGWAVIASTATTVAAFFPMLFWPGVMGDFMGYLPLTVVITLLSSLFVALVINPTLCSVFLKPDTSLQSAEDDIPDNLIYRSYLATLTFSLNHRLLVVLAAILSLVGTFMAYGALNHGVEFFPESTPEEFTVALEAPDGTRLERTDEILETMEKPLLESADPGLVEAWITSVGVGHGGMPGAGGTANHFGKINVDLLPGEEQQADPYDLMQRLRAIYENIPGANIVLHKRSMGPPSGAPVNIEIEGQDLAVSNQLARQIKERIRTIPGLIDLEDDVELSRPEIHVEVDRDRAAMAKLDTQSVAQTVRTAINGTKASVFREGDEEYDITVRLPDDLRRALGDIERLTVVNRDGDQIPLVEVAHIEIRGGAGSIRHKDQERVVTISASNDEGYLPDDLVRQARERIEDLEVPAGYAIRFTGQQEDQREAQEFLGTALLVALFLIALILVTEFNSVLQPFIILTSVVLSLIGVLWSLVLTGEPFGVIMTGIGVISLAGVVVNNAIVLIDYTNQLINEGMARRDAIVRAGLVRFRPVMLTAVTTVLGFIPLVIGVAVDFVNWRVVFGGRSVEMWQPMARTIAGGLVVATVLTLVVVPVLLSLFEQLSNQSKALLDRIGGAGRARTIAGVLLVSTSAVAITALLLGPSAAQAQQQPAPVAAHGSVILAQAAADDDDDDTFSTPQGVVEEGQVIEAEVVDLETLRIPSERTLTLGQALERVEKANFDVRIAASQIAVADAQIQQAWSTLYPTVVANGSVTVNEREITADFGGGAMLPPGVPTPEPVVIQNKVDWRVGLSASLLLNARAWPLLQQAYLQKDLTREQVELVREQVELAVMQLYYNLLFARRNMDQVAAKVASDKTLMRATELRREAGVAKPFELTRTRLRVAQGAKDLEVTRLQFLKIRLALAQLLQVEADFDVAPPRDRAPPRDLSALKEAALKNRANVDLQQMQVKMAELSIDEAQMQYVPSLAAVFNWNRSRGTLLQPGEFLWTLTFSAEWVIFDGFRREAEIDARQAQLLTTKLQLDQAAAQLLSDVEQAWVDYLSAQAQREGAETQVELARQGLLEASRAFDLGAATQLDVITAKDQLELANLQLLHDSLNVQMAVHSLRLLAGLEE